VYGGQLRAVSRQKEHINEKFAYLCVHHSGFPIDATGHTSMNKFKELRDGYEWDVPRGALRNLEGEVYDEAKQRLNHMKNHNGEDK
jgi:hypothetical protein